jgi:hypothetical protein
MAAMRGPVGAYSAAPDGLLAIGSVFAPRAGCGASLIRTTVGVDISGSAPSAAVATLRVDSVLLGDASSCGAALHDSDAPISPHTAQLRHPRTDRSSSRIIVDGSCRAPSRSANNCTGYLTGTGPSGNSRSKSSLCKADRKLRFASPSA